MIPAGSYRHKVSLQTRSANKNSIGEHVDAWVDSLTNVSACVYDVSGEELLADQSVRALVRTVVKIRYRTGISAKMRVVFRGMYYNVLAIVDRDKRNIELELLCAEGLANG